MKIPFRSFVQFLVIASLSTACLTESSTSPVVTVVQSIPEETALAQQDLPYALETWVAMIDGATRSIDVAQMYVSSKPGEGIEKVMEALTRAANRGVRIRFLISENMIGEEPETLAAVRAIPGIEVAIINVKPLTGGIMHAKYWIVDEAEAFIGSQNFDWRALSQIHETGVLVRDAAFARKLGRIFHFDWEIARTGKAPEKGKALAESSSDVELVASPELLNPAGVGAALPALLGLIAGAKRSLQIQLLEYSPASYSAGGDWLEIDDALRAAAARGVKVQLLVSHWNTAKSSIGALKRLTAVPNVEVKVAFVPEHSTGFIPYARVIHSKQMIVDQEIYWVGTSNWSRGYFYATRNVEVIMRRPELARTGARIFDTVWNQSYTEAVDPNREYPKPRKGP